MRFENWKEYIFSEFIDINPSVRLDSSKDYSFVEMKDLNEKQKFVYPSTKRKLSGGARFQEYDILFARITPCLENGKICQVRGLENGVGFGSTEFLVFRGRKGISDNDFVFYLSRYSEVRQFAEQNMLGTSGRQRVTWDAFDKLELRLPPLPIQLRIASILSAIDDKIELNSQTNQTLEAIAQAIYKEWFANFNFPGATGEMQDSEVGPIPKGWRVGGIGSLCFVQNGYAFKSDAFSDDVGDCGVIKIKNIRGNLVDVNDMQYVTTEYVASIDPKFRIKPESLLIAMTGAEVGKIGLVPLTEKELWLNQRVGMFIEKIINSNCFLYILLSGDDYQNIIRNSALGSAQPNISASAIEDIKVLLPPEKLIVKFGEVVRPLFDRLLRNVHESNLLNQIRNHLLSKLMSGEIEV